MKSSAIILSLAGIALAAAANANTVTLKYISSGAGRAVKISNNSGSAFQNVFGGVLNMKVDGLQVQQMFCVDPKTRMSSGNYSTSKLSTSEMPLSGQRVGYLVNKYLPMIQGESNSSLKNDMSLALQLTLWEVVSETSGPVSLSGGVFRAKAASGSFTQQQETLINEYMSDAGSGVATYYKSALDECNNPVSQSMVTAVPEPATIGALVIGFGTLLRRRAKK